ncbi:MAG: OsmC family protein [Thermodesulfobacteriota bacterium]
MCAISAAATSTIHDEHFVNGVDVDKVHISINAIEENPNLAKFKFHLSNRWISGGRSHSTVSDFYGAGKNNFHLKPFEINSDEPAILAGSDTAANPVEQLLNSLAACLTTSLIYHAALTGIEIEELESELEGDIDVRGFLGLSDKVSKGYEDIHVKFKVKTDEENLEKLRGFTKYSPVFGVITNETPVKVSIERK